MHSNLLAILLSYSLLLISCGPKATDESSSIEPGTTQVDSITRSQPDMAEIHQKPDPVFDGFTFDKIKWTTREGKDYPFRDEMYEVLMTDTIFRSLKYDEVVSVLGKPDRSDGSYLFYTISQKRLGAWPINTKTLVIKFKEDNTIEWIKLHG